MDLKISDRILKETHEEDLKILTKVCEPVKEESIDVDSMVKLKEQMLAMMHTHNGRGLAAPQVGLSIRVLVMVASDGTEYFMVNPEIIKKSSIKHQAQEGCLSIPDKKQMTFRSKQVKVKYLDEHGVEYEAMLGGMNAVCLQHEMDHLDGILMHNWSK